MKPANHYASTTPIPDWIEAELLKLSKDADYICALAIDLSEALFYGAWSTKADINCYKLSDRAYEWLNSQDRDTFKVLLQWVAMELI